MKFIPVEFSAMSVLVVHREDPEFADISNPRGEIYGGVYFVVARDAEGNRVRKEVASEAVAEKQVKALQTRLDVLKKLPVGFGVWEEWNPVYVTPA